MKLPTLLDGLPQGAKADRLIPWAAALSVAVPLIKQNDPLRAHCIPMFEEWVRDRDQEISVQQVAWLWENFCSQFAKESVKRFTQWAHDPLSKDLKSPMAISRMLFRIWRDMHFAPWKARLQTTTWGRMVYRGMQCAGFVAVFSVAFPVFFTLAGLATWALLKLQAPARMTLMLLGIL